MRKTSIEGFGIPTPETSPRRSGGTEAAAMIINMLIEGLLTLGFIGFLVTVGTLPILYIVLKIFS